MLPGVKIIYQNGSLGQVEPMADGCLGFLALGMTVDEGSQFLLETPYTLKKLSDLEDLGIAEGSLLHRNVKDFYAEAGDGTELWVMGFQWGSYFNSVLDKDNAEGAVSLLKAARGKIRGLIAFREYDEETQSGNGFEGGIDSDVMSSLPMAQGLGEWATDVLRAPIFTLIEAHAYRFDKDLEEPGVLPNLRQMQYNRVGLVIGDTEENSPNACMGVVAGRIACSPVQRKISRVKDGAVKPLKIYINDQLAEVADVEAIHEMGFITFRTFVGKSGYFIADDMLATEAADDYNSLTNRRVIDKAYRIAYNTLLNVLNDEVPIASDGNLSPSWCVSVQGDVEQDIITQMTANGNLGNDPGDSADTGVKCVIPYEQQILRDHNLEVILQVKPNGYPKYINVKLGFKTA